MKADTIYALASGASRAGVAVVRISGPESKAAFATLSDAQLEPRRAVRMVVKDKESGDKLDDGLAILFPAPASFTGEDIVELHIHGGRAVIAGVLEALGRLQGLRLAEPGEFTRRAFESGKMDLTAAEGLADLVAAETEAQRRQALRQSRGELGNLYESWRQRLTEALAHFEASIDFSDEELPSTLAEEVEIELTSLTDEIDVHLADDRRGERLSVLPFVPGQEVLEPLRVEQKTKKRLSPTGRTFIAVDTVGAGEGEVVLCVQGSSARFTPQTEKLPVDAAIVGIVDQVHVGDVLVEVPG